MPVVLYDLPSKAPCKCWSLNPWKTRMILNFKGIDYSTKWVEFPDLVATFDPLPLEPNTEGYPYTIPTISLEGKYIMDSFKIAQALEERYPNPPLHLEDPMLQQLLDLGREALSPLRALLTPRVPTVVPERSAQYYHASRKEQLGMTLGEWERSVDPKEAWNAALPRWKRVVGLLKERPGPYFGGEEISYADLVIVSLWRYLEIVNLEIFEQVMGVDEAFPHLYRLCKKYLARDNH